jgi:hypothetical protein
MPGKHGKNYDMEQCNVNCTINKIVLSKLPWIIVLLMTLVIGFSNIVRSQVGGISGSKLAAYCVDVVDHKKLEFEPAFFHARSKKQWDGQGNLNDLYETPDSVRYRTGLYFRFTYGLWDKLEIGGQVSIEQAISNWGVR